VVFYLIFLRLFFEFFWIFKIASYTMKDVEFNGKNHFP
jgi:hypothetical protein